MSKDYYAILGLSRGASAEEVKAAYRKLSKELHPDKHKGDKGAEEKFKAVNEAYEVLSNPQKKQMYDQFGSADAGAGFGGFGGGQGFGGFDFSGFQQGGGADFADIFESFFGGSGGARAQRDERGRDLEVGITITFAESVSGLNRDVQVRRREKCDVCDGNGAEPGSQVVTCSDCGGTGQVTRTAQSLFGVIQQRTVCPRCKGSGRVPEKACHKCNGEGRTVETSTISVQVPAGIADGQTLRLRGEGEAGARGAAAGDLYVHVSVKADPRYQREGDDIHSSIDVSVLDAILGTEIEIDTVQGRTVVKVPEGTQPGTVLRIKGKGMPVLNTSRTGDHYVEVRVKIPTKLSRQERKLMEEWRGMV